ncbi:MAG: YiiX/YebB-like N1pC/P60 family cysteine hydrolase [Vulcanimicrobiota bacterium]
MKLLDSIGQVSVNSHSPVTAKKPGNVIENQDKVEIGGKSKEKPLKETLMQKFVKGISLRFPTVTPRLPKEEQKKILELIKPGDIIIETNDGFPIGRVLQKATTGSDYTHAAMYVGNGKYIEATPVHDGKSGVLKSDFKDLLNHRIHIEVIRPDYKTSEDRQAAIDYVESRVGQKYDYVFDANEDKKLYCAELVYHALSNMPNPIKVPTDEVLGQKSVGVNSMQQIPGAQKIYSTGSSVPRAVLNAFPTSVGAVVGGIAGGVVAGPLGAVAGSLIGAVNVMLIGNKMQTGKFSLYPDYIPKK